MSLSSPGSVVGRVSTLHRYPVKSLRGETLPRVLVEDRGVRGDRLWAVCDPDGKLGSGKSNRRFRRMDGLLDLSATYDGETPVVAFPDGSRHRGDGESLDAALSAYIGRPVSLARESGVSHFDDGPLHLVTTSGMRLLAGARDAPVDATLFRANVVLDTGEQPGFVEERWIGRHLAVGEEVVLSVYDPMPRCVMLGPSLLRTVNTANDGQFGVVADVVRSGTVAVGDVVRLTG